ncbi:MAG: amidase [Pseudomonadota bacterium]
MTRYSFPTSITPDPLGAFMDHAPYSLDGYAAEPRDGPLSGLTLGVKDLFDVAGFKTGAGSPTWMATAREADQNAPSVAALFGAGARFVGKTTTDEIAWSLNGENAHYGTPVNPAAPGRIPGGSSSGSASAVAGKLVDIGLGSDTGGSVRLPASYCGLWGLRPTHGRIDISGAVPLAPGFDTVGWFTRDADTFQRVGAVFFDGEPEAPTRLMIAEDMFARASDDVRQALHDKAILVGELLNLDIEHITLCPTDAWSNGLLEWREAFRICQSSEAWEVHGAWAERETPDFGPGIKDRFAYAKGLSANQVAGARAARKVIAKHLHESLTPGTLLIVPGAAGVAPLKGLEGPELDDIRGRALDLLCPAGLASLPQLAVPALRLSEGPVGLGIIGCQGADEALLAIASQLEGL